ncbi:MAG: lipopolysaccharide biosynthesis protein [Verrucomicrobiota bacterium]|jgi:PST family polysaccharide transporter
MVSTTTPKEVELKRVSALGGAHTVLAQGVCYAAQMVSTVILARLLTPRDFGLVALVTSITSMLGYFGVDLGLTDATIQRKDLTRAQSNGLFWISVCSGGFFALATCASAPALAWFYREPRLVLISVAIAPSFVFQGVAVQHLALLSREMRFGTVAMIQSVSIVGGAVVAIGAALLGAGYWSLVAQPVVAALGSALAAWSLNRWRPGLPTRGVGLRSFLHFGRNVTMFNFLNQFARSFDKIVIGRICGAAALGYYTRAAYLLLLPLGQVILPFGKVLVPVLSRLQDDRERFRNYFCKALNAAAFGIFIPVAALMALSDDVILVLLGPAWKESALLFKVLALSALTQPLFSAVTWVATAQGKTREMRQWSLVSAPLICAAFLVGAKWGVVGVAASYTVTSYTIQAFGLNYLLGGTPINSRTILASVWRPAFISALVFLGASLCSHWTAASGPLLRIIIASLFGFLLAAGAVASWPSARKEVMGLWATFKLLRSPST